jgi:hypothetical protein
LPNAAKVDALIIEPQLVQYLSRVTGGGETDISTLQEKRSDIWLKSARAIAAAQNIASWRKSLFRCDLPQITMDGRQWIAMQRSALRDTFYSLPRTAAVSAKPKQLI